MISRAILRTTALPLSGPFPTLDPFLFCVYHVDKYPADASGGKMETPITGNGSDFDPTAPYRMYHGKRVPGFPAHPHRGFETVTATISCLIDHADSVGNHGWYGEGDVQWMTAGAGVVHGEMFPLVHSDKPNHLRLFQIWLNLPSRKKMSSPGFAMFWAEDVPVWESWASDPENDVAILHIVISPGGELILPRANRDGVNRSLYLIEGHTNGVKVDGRVISERACLDMDSTRDVLIENPTSTTSEGSANDDDDDFNGRRAEFLLLQGRPIGEPVASHGPFVMNTYAEIDDAISDYRRTGFGGWPWSRDDVVFPREKGRFAVINGVETRPPTKTIGKKVEL
ncbi:hypothetical protein ACHAXA_002557 [Cyclostephanos tholiformis]|uniref:Pirin n=1 Tax=Cyclostephanos tholiformis TaxID=382380 RepID=A0ABD3R0U2_9STRA